ncbi:MAG: BA14K family protein [Candidatus Devosia phytovorans]|uniref:Lectin-like protein BA14k n=1 Tax=Candidatus Devosia phytovorans TaxID=3121372 RepID=A0AAJ5VX17_9HYPH|nr:BA14K family protein [Devosia sp.]WEK06493.1 MAG: BA14K family protein [Devosia sp.]
MNILRAGVIGAALTSAMAVSAVAPAQAQGVTFSYGQRAQVIETYCDRYPNDYDCRGYYGGRWTDRDYDRFYSSRRDRIDPIASGLFGLAFGAILGGALANSNNSGGGDRVIGRVTGDGYSGHVAACYARYRSYDEETDTFMGYDGIRRRCNL